MLVLTIQPEDYPFLVEAIRLRSNMMINSLAAQVDRQTQRPAEPAPKKVDAPWGYKKDGTPKARPGRKP